MLLISIIDGFKIRIFMVASLISLRIKSISIQMYSLMLIWLLFVLPLYYHVSDELLIYVY
jgi:hypothetical protein